MSPCNAKSTGIPLSIHSSVQSLMQRTPINVMLFHYGSPIEIESDGDTIPIRTTTRRGSCSALWRNSFHFHVSLSLPTMSNGVSIMMTIMMPAFLAFHPILYINACNVRAHPSTGLFICPIFSRLALASGTDNAAPCELRVNAAWG